MAEPRNIMVAAIRKDGTPQMTPNWFLWKDGHFYISTTKTRAKYTNLKRDPRVQLALADPQSFRALIIDGRCEILENIDEFLPFSLGITQKHTGQTPSEQAARERLIREQRVILKITPAKSIDQWLSWQR
ncbi:MAG: PPOX class F420-dependent oxidoreductase [Dehalococcoidia bacterium]